ncbi:MAG: hypothetical protein MUC36_07395 [Planctomycetes bacterium]|jgi:hypothetical protein|nr:hypothetical protein [Planctomycetota bacterium]
MKLSVPLVLLSAAFAAAQSPAPWSATADGKATIDADIRVPVHGRDGDPGYGLWAAGRDYKASFHDGMTFVPYLGGAYPHNQPLSWHTTSVRVGELELLTAGRVPHLQHGDYQVRYDHGQVVETYDVLAEGLEQRFVLSERPLAAGALQIQGSLQTALWSPAVENAHQGLVFHDAEGRAILGYGAATAIDADGDCFAMTTSQADGVITLTLAADDLARADFPLVVDPLLATQLAIGIGTSSEPGEIDAANDGTSGLASSLLAFTLQASAMDSDLRVHVGTAVGGNANGVFADIAVAASADHARVAFVAATNRWVIVYQNLIAATQLMQVRAAVLPANPGGPAQSSSIPLLTLPGTHHWRPEVGGVLPGGAGNRALVVLQRETGTAQFANTANSSVWGAFLDTSTATGSWTTPFLIQGNASDDTERPSVNRAAEGGNAFSWFVVCQAFTNNAGNDDWDLFGRLVDQAGGVSPQAWISSLGTTHKLGARVDGSAGRYAVVFSTANTSIGKNLDVVGNDLRCERVDWPHGQGGQSVSGDWPVQTLSSSAFRTLEACSIAQDVTSDSHWTLAWRNSSTAPALYASRVGYRGQALQAPDLVVATGVSSPGPATVMVAAAAGATTVFYAIGNQGWFEVQRRRFDLPVATAPSVVAGSCGGPVLSWTGPSSVAGTNQLMGNEFCGPRVVGAGPNDLHLMLVAVATASLPLVDPIAGTGCTLLVPFGGPDYLGYLTPAIGADVRWSLPLPESLPSLTVHFQDWVLRANDGRFWGSGRLTVPLVR